MTSTAAAPTRPARTVGWVQVTLIVFVAFPLVAGLLRLLELVGGPQTLPYDERMAQSPLPVGMHIVGAAGYAVLGALQFSAGLRRRHLQWHRVMGRVTVFLGLAVALSALWMTLFYPRQPGSGELAFVFRVVFSSAMAVCLVLGTAMIRRRQLAAHRAWMIRAYAIALAAATQMFTLGFAEAALGASVIAHDLALGSAWFINLGIAEWVIRRGGHPRPSRSSRRTNAVAR